MKLPPVNKKSSFIPKGKERGRGKEEKGSHHCTKELHENLLYLTLQRIACKWRQNSQIVLKGGKGGFSFPFHGILVDINCHKEMQKSKKMDFGGNSKK